MFVDSVGRTPAGAFPPPLRNSIQFGHGQHGGTGQGDPRAKRLKRWMLAEVLGGTLLIFSTPFVEPLVANMMGEPHPHAVVRGATESHGDEFCLATPQVVPGVEGKEIQPVRTDAEPAATGQTQEPGGAAEATGKFGAAALISGLFALFHYGMHAVSGGLFYKFGKHRAEEELASQGRHFEGIRELLRERLGVEGEDYVVVSQGDEEIILRRKSGGSGKGQ